jgi:ABC-type lipoprotein export system ATPase subunit
VLTNGEAGSGKTRLKNACICIICHDEGSLRLDSYNLSAEEFTEYRRNNKI